MDSMNSLQEISVRHKKRTLLIFETVLHWARAAHVGRVAVLVERFERTSNI